MKSVTGTTKVKEVYKRGYSREESIRNDLRWKKVLEVVKKIAPPGKIRTILDIGCGDGYIAEELGKVLNAVKVSGIDIAEAAVKYAKGRGVDARQLDVDLESLPYKSSSIDFIYCGSLIELIADPDHLLTEIHRVINPDGYIVITVPNMCAWGSRVAVMCGYLPFYFRVSTRYDLGKLMSGVKDGRSTGFIRLQSLRSFRQLAGLYGFEEVGVYGAPAEGLPVALSVIDKFFTRFPDLAFQMIFVLKKR